MRFSLSDAKCEVKVVIEVEDVKHPVHGYKACVDEADIRDSTTNRRTRFHPTICAHANSKELAIGRLFMKIYRMMV